MNIKSCAVCGDNNNLKKCSACRSVYYCGTVHQQQDWYQHKAECKRIREQVANSQKLPTATTTSSSSSASTSKTVATTATSAAVKRCGLCGSTKKLRKTDCCKNWICDDQDDYVMFTYARNSCSRNHSKHTLCATHHDEQHRAKDWKNCKECKEFFGEDELYVWYGTNEYNFEKLPNPPSFKPTTCQQCGKVIRLGTDGYSVQFGKKGYTCTACSR